MEKRDLPLAAYGNTNKFFDCRKIERLTPELKDDQFNIEMRSTGYVIIEGIAAERGTIPRRKTVLVIFSATSEASRKKGNFKKLLDQIRAPSSKISKSSENILGVDLIFISNDKPVSAISGYDEIVSELKATINNVYIEAYTYEKLIITPENSIIPTHRIMSQEEVDKLNNDRLTSDSRRPTIYQHDTPIVWIGGRPGDVIEIRRASGATGYSITYRVVK